MLHRLTVLVIGCGLALCRPVHATETLVFAHLFPETSIQHRVLLTAKQELAAESRGELALEVIPRGLVGDQDTRIIEAISVGRADMTFAGGAFAARDYAPIGLISAPYNFRDFEHWLHFRDSPLAQELATGYEKASGMVVLGYVYYGVRQISSKRPILSPQDMAGLTIRSGNAPLFLQFFRAFGAKPVPLPFGQIQEALKSGQVDAQDNPLSVIDAFKIYEVAPYVSLTSHITDSQLTVIGGQRFHKLTGEQQRIVREVFARASNRLTDLLRQSEIAALDSLRKKNVTLIAVDRAAFVDLAKPLLTGSTFAWSGELYQRLQNIP